MRIRISSNQLLGLGVASCLLVSNVGQGTPEFDDRESEYRYVTGATLFVRGEDGKLSSSREIELTVKYQRAKAYPIALLGSAAITGIAGYFGGLIPALLSLGPAKVFLDTAKKTDASLEKLYWRPLEDPIFNRNLLSGDADQAMTLESRRAEKLRALLKKAGAIAMDHAFEFTLSIYPFYEAGEPRFLVVAGKDGVEKIYFQKDRYSKMWDIDSETIPTSELREKPIFVESDKSVKYELEEPPTKEREQQRTTKRGDFSEGCEGGFLDLSPSAL